MSQAAESSEKKIYQTGQGMLTWLPDYHKDGCEAVSPL